ncbi:carboxypeptidase regulatory-like domain-containing protein [Candidatus Neomarinimicrobiota bacterium]
MRKISLVIFLVVWTGLIFAQTAGKVSGTVTDENGQPLAGANVVVVGTSFGGASDSEGNYYILQVPAGTHDIRADYIGYKSETVDGVRIATELTSFIDFALEIAAVEGESVEVIGERPLLEMSATNAVRSMDTDQITNFASRNVDDMIQAQAGIVLHNSEVHLRGSRADEVGYTLDGVSTKAVQGFNNAAGSNYNIISVIPEALQEISVQSGGYSAELGGSNAGIVQQTMRTGGRTLRGSVGFMTDQIGTKDFTLTVGGPIVEKIRFFGAYRMNDTDNINYRWFTGGVINADENGDPIPILNTNSTDPDNPEYVALEIPDEEEGGEQTTHSLNSTLLFDFNPLIVRASGAYDYRTNRTLFATNINGGYVYNMFNMDRQRKNEWNIFLGALKATYFLNSQTYVHFTVSGLSRQFEGYDPEFDHENLSDILEYGDGDIVEEKGLTTATNPADGSTLDGTWDSRFSPAQDYLLSQFAFVKPGSIASGWAKNEQTNIGAKGGFTTQVGTHDLRIGFDYLKWTNRNYAVTGSGGLVTSVLQQIDNDPSLQAEFDNETDVAANILRRSRAVNVGYDEFGNEITDKNHIDAAKNPYSLSFYVNDKIEKDDLVVNAGIRVDAYNMDDWVMVDPENPGYDESGASFLEDQLTDASTHTVIQPRLGLGFPVSDKAVFHLQYGKFVQMPDMALAFRSRSQLALFMGGQNFIPNPSGFDLEPVVTEQFEVGFGYQLGNVAALDMTVFAKNTTGQLEIKWASVDPNNTFGASDYAYYDNGDFTNVSGVELTARTRRINIFQIDGSFTYTDARGTNSFPGSGAGQVEINKDNDHAPSMIAPLRYENKYKGTGTIDMRWADGEGGILANSGLNMHMSFNSGHSFTMFSGGMGQRNASRGALLEDGDPRARVPIEPIGSSTTPWVFNFNLRAEKGFNVGGVMLTAYALVQNLFDTKQVINVYNRTGNAFDDGFLTDPELSGKIVENLGDTFVELYETMNLGNRQHWINDHGFDLFGIPRAINFGITASF